MDVFFDSNIAIYAVGDDGRKTTISEGLMQAGGWISVQVLNEVLSASRRKMRHDWSRTLEILRTIKSLTDVISLTPATHDRGVDLARRYQFSPYDAMIVAAAIEAECERLYTEDMHHGLIVDDRLTIINPFL